MWQEQIVSQLRSAFTSGRLTKSNNSTFQCQLDLLATQYGLEMGTNPGAIRAVVVLMFYLKDGNCHFLVTRRAAHMRTAPNELVLPGGKIEPGETEIDAALREQHEEASASASTADVLGTLPTFIRILGTKTFEITPVVVFTEQIQNFVANEGEVAEIIEVPCELWLAPRSSNPLFFSVNSAGETLMRGNAFAMEMFRKSAF